MKVTPFEFRFRFLILAVIYFLGFATPWNYWLHLDSIRTWQLLAAWPARSGWISFSTATIVVLLLGILCALKGAILRTWASAYLGTSIVQDPSMHGEGVVAAGPYRHLRNPLYLGTFIHTFALALLMPPSGAILCILAIGLFLVRLIAAEESFLTAKLGAPYLAYCAKVPSLLRSIKPRVPASTTQPKWPIAFLGEIYMWGVVVTFAFLGWRYNSVLLIKGVLISLGISLIVRAFIPKR
jgi:protein-S-isoprenylcysteine O-methyltransferase Ste14